MPRLLSLPEERMKLRALPFGETREHGADPRQMILRSSYRALASPVW